MFQLWSPLPKHIRNLVQRGNVTRASTVWNWNQPNWLWSDDLKKPHLEGYLPRNCSKEVIFQERLIGKGKSVIRLLFGYLHYLLNMSTAECFRRLNLLTQRENIIPEMKLFLYIQGYKLEGINQEGNDILKKCISFIVFL